MKKVLLATSALTLSAGFASADVSMSGTGGAGVFGANGADLSVYSGVDLGFALSGASDNGMTFSASLDMGGGQTLDAGDFELDTQDMGVDDNVSVTIGVSGLTIVLSQNGVDDLYDDDKAGDIGISGAMGDLTYSVVTGLEDADPTSLSVGYTAGAVSGSVALLMMAMHQPYLSHTQWVTSLSAQNQIQIVQVLTRLQLQYLMQCQMV